MDPIGITTSILEVGFKVKDAIDKFAKYRRHAKELASDVAVDLRRITEFYEKNRSILSHEALGPLYDSLDVLKSDLYRIHKRCQAYELKQDDTKRKRLILTIKLWMDADGIEADLVRIKERIQTSMNCISLLSCACMEVGIMKLERTILVNAFQTRSRIQQLDRVFSQELLNGDPGLRAFDRSPSTLNNIDAQYIRLKTVQLMDTISGATLATGGTSTFPELTQIGVLLPKLKLNYAIFTVTDLHSRASKKMLPVRSLVKGTLYLAEVLHLLGALDITVKILGTVEARKR